MHTLEPRLVREQLIDFPGQDREIVAADGHTALQKMIGVALLLARNGIHDHHDQPFRQGFGSSQAAGLADQQVGGRHESLHFTSEPDDVELRRPVRSLSDLV